MRVFADFHLHSLHSRATSKEMNLEQLAKNAKLKGLNILGTGDFTFPAWFRNLKQKLELIEGTGLFKYNDIFWMLTVEVSTIYPQEGKIRKIHHVIHVPNFEVAEQINEKLRKRGRLDIDGRPIFNNLTSPELVELVIETYNNALIVPAHAWTPFYSCFGSKSGFNSMEECYQDQTKHIHALETGMSSDPPMNWRLSSLDKFTLMSNSDSHSPWPWRLGRECNVFELDKLTYWEIVNVIKKKDKKRFLFTVETEPSYGKYHLDGHRKCGISLNPKQTIKLNNICPRCGRKLTIGVLHRVEELADRPEGFVPEDAVPCKDLIPLTEIICSIHRIDTLYSRTAWDIYMKLIDKFENEFNVLLNVPEEELEKVVSKNLVEAIIKVREGKVKIIPGFDGVYGKPVFDEFEFKRYEEKQKNVKIHSQKRLIDFKGL